MDLQTAFRKISGGLHFGKKPKKAKNSNPAQPRGHKGSTQKGKASAVILAKELDIFGEFKDQRDDHVDLTEEQDQGIKIVENFKRGVRERKISTNESANGDDGPVFATAEESMNHRRHTRKIKVKGEEVPDLLVDWLELPERFEEARAEHIQKMKKTLKRLVSERKHVETGKKRKSSRKHSKKKTSKKARHVDYDEDEDGLLDNPELRKAKLAELSTTIDGLLEELAWMQTEADDADCEWLTNNILTVKGYIEPTPIQSQAIPALLNHRELLAISPTGSGKTASFLVPLLASLSRSKSRGVRAVVVSPTKELAIQIHHEAELLAKARKLHINLITRSTAKTANFRSDTVDGSHHDLIITTPLLLVQMLEEGRADLTNVEWLVFDEGDRLFELGFLEQVDTILGACTHPRVTRALFSATLPPAIEELARTVLRDPIRVTVGARYGAAVTINQQLKFCGDESGKILEMRQLIAEGVRPPILVFVQSVDRAKQLEKELKLEGMNVDAIHSDKTTAQRQAIIQRFRTGALWFLVTTDLLARGMDFKGVNMVINYDFPQTPVSYIHRIGRTGRNGRPGKAVTLFTRDDAVNLRSIVNVMRSSGCDVPEWMLGLKAPNKKQRRALARRPVERKDITSVPKFKIEREAMIRQSKANKRKRTASESHADDIDVDNVSNDDDYDEEMG
eukprot:Clim_evm29s229 gene=Clim_evmTU29s229